MTKGLYGLKQTSFYFMYTRMCNNELFKVYNMINTQAKQLVSDMKLLLWLSSTLCNNNKVVVFGTANPDPEGQGFCQAGFSVDFTKVTTLSLRPFMYVRHVQIIFHMIYCKIPYQFYCCGNFKNMTQEGKSIAE